MSTEILDLMAQRISSGLRRKSIINCAKWAEAYRVIKGEPWGFKYHPWLREMHECDAQLAIGQKAAQLGYTEWALNTTFYKIDLCATDCLYVLPTKGDASTFSAGRFDPALEAGPHLRSMFTDVKNVELKRAGQNCLYVRGSRSRSGLKSIPCGFVVFDELDEMTQENIPLALERMSGQETKQCLMISTPTSENHGVNKYFQTSTQEEFYFKCPSCKRLIKLSYPDSLVITSESLGDPNIKKSHLICTACKVKLPHENKHEWLSTGRFVPKFPTADPRGFACSQLYSCMIDPVDLARHVLRAEYDNFEAQELYNSKLGVPFEASDARLSANDIQENIGPYKSGPAKGSKLITMGVDVGKVLHFEVDEWTFDREVGVLPNENAKCRVLKCGTVHNFSDLDALMHEFRVNYCVIDAQPEVRSALAFAERFYGNVRVCYYVRGFSAKQFRESPEEECKVSVDRTSWLDLSLSRFKSQRIQLPSDLHKDYLTHLTAVAKIYKQDQDGNPTGRYENNGADHFAHARNYAEIALPMAAGYSANEDIKSW